MTGSSYDTPEGRRRVVRALLVAAPFGFVGAYLLAAVQGAEPRHALLIAAVMLVGCLGAAALFHVAGTKSQYAVIAIALLRLLVRR